MSRVILVDGDIVVYKASFGSEAVHQFDDENWVSSANEKEAREKFNSIVTMLADRLKADSVVIALSDPEANWRKTIYPAYKQQRTKTRRPILLKPMREYARAMTKLGELPVKVYTRPTLEADDILGILATHPTLIKGKTCVCSIDKDLLQVPGWHHNIDKNETKRIDEVDGDHWHLVQTLVGDVVDNYPGCPGIGPKKAAGVLIGWPPKSMEVWKQIVKEFEKKGLTENDALVQAQIARICRATEYDFATKQVKPWCPSQQ